MISPIFREKHSIAAYSAAWPFAHSNLALGRSWYYMFRVRIPDDRNGAAANTLRRTVARFAFLAVSAYN